MVLEVDLDSFVAAHDANATVLDVREGVEYVAGHVPGAVLIPLATLPSRLAEVEKPGPVYVICATGNRSITGAAILRSAGFDAYSVAGGTRDWVLSGREVVTGPAPR
jgi:rhodanese-related sulfurtransferase